MTDLTESLKGFTDLPIFLLGLIFALLVLKKNKKWALLFFLISFTSLFGAAVHIFSFKISVLNFLWVILYPLLFETVRNASLLLSAYIYGQDKKENRVIFIFEIILYIAAVAAMYICGKYDMIFFATFAAVCLFRTAVSFFKTEKTPKKAVALVILLMFPLILQILSGVIPYAVIFEHLCILGLLFVTFKIASEKQKT